MSCLLYVQVLLHLRQSPQGTRIYRKSDSSFDGSFKKAVRITKRVENGMVDKGVHVEVPSYFIECLSTTPGCLSESFDQVETIKGVIYHIWSELKDRSLPTAMSAGLRSTTSSTYFTVSTMDTAERWILSKGSMELPGARVVTHRMVSQVAASIVVLVFAAGIWGNWR